MGHHSATFLAHALTRLLPGFQRLVEALVVHVQVSEFGSVDVGALMEIERYSHVMHISSTVTGRLKAGLDAWDALRAALPAGTVSGAPKVRLSLILCPPSHPLLLQSWLYSTRMQQSLVQSQLLAINPDALHPAAL